jgi:hypothetical protein
LKALPIKLALLMGKVTCLSLEIDSYPKSKSFSKEFLTAQAIRMSPRLPNDPEVVFDLKTLTVTHPSKLYTTLDNLMVIESLAAELKQPIAACWVIKTRTELLMNSRERHNVDKLATQQYEEIHTNPPMRNINHIACQQISLTINGQQYPLNWDTNVWWSIYSTYLKQFLTNKHDWSRKTWGTINPQIMKAYHNHNTKKLSTKTMWFKVNHNLHLLGVRKQKMDIHMNSNIDIENCPW